MNLERKPDHDPVDDKQGATAKNPESGADILSNMASRFASITADRLTRFDTIGDSQSGVNRHNSARKQEIRSQSSGQQNPIGNITRLYKEHLGSNESITDLIIDYSSIKEEYTLYVVIDEESLDLRMDVMRVTQNIREIHPKWDITVHVVAIETDPDLGQVPKSATTADKLLEQKDSSEFGYAF